MHYCVNVHECVCLIVLERSFRSIFLVVYLGSTVFNTDSSDFDLKLNVLPMGLISITAIILKTRKKWLFLNCPFSLNKLKKQERIHLISVDEKMG